MIGIDPKMSSHTAAAIDATEKVMSKITVKVTASAEESERLSEGAKDWPERTWAIENGTALRLSFDTAALANQ